MKYLGQSQSGSMADTTASRNRNGQYYRRRAQPVNPNSSFQGVVRGRIATNSAAWRAISDNQRAGWADLALSINRTDSLGQSHTLNGFEAFMSVNTNNLSAGNAPVVDAPAVVTPSDLLTAVITLTSAAFSVAYTTTPLAAGQRLFSYISPQVSAGRKFNKNFKLIAVSAAAAASPANLLAAYTARYGVPVTGNRIFMQFKIYQAGFLSGPLSTSAVVA